MINAKEELKRYIDVKDILCAEVSSRLHGHKFTSMKLKIEYSKIALREFLKKLNFKYDDDEYGMQKLVGTIWMKNGSWLERCVNDGVEMWRVIELSKIPPYLHQKETKKIRL